MIGVLAGLPGEGRAQQADNVPGSAAYLAPDVLRLQEGGSERRRTCVMPPPSEVSLDYLKRTPYSSTVPSEAFLLLPFFPTQDR